MRTAAFPGSFNPPTVAHLVPEYYPLVQSVLDGGPFVAHTVWESDRLPQHWPDLLNATDLVVVPTAWNRDVFVASGVHVQGGLDGKASEALFPQGAARPIAAMAKFAW